VEGTSFAKADAQLRQWLHFEAPLDDGRTFDADLFDQLFEEEVGLLAEVPTSPKPPTSSAKWPSQTTSSSS
jgi:hypothetical protein